MRVSDRSLYISLGYILFSVPMLILEIFYSASQIRYNFFFTLLSVLVLVAQKISVAN